ncbi:INSIG domain protein [Sphaerosporella brunnea]|uniref:INSIG domain protein n=1 Tax=Sphaerosporella brunnea TaxID=1250544 RepID=A0A5J5EWQ8_9PEZI|nr:INSIG domain protein [Sphaerosporella brunnea]
MSDNLQIQRPIPRRPFDLQSDLSSPTSLGGNDFLDPSGYQSDSTSAADGGPVKRSRSAVSLTASTLFGIYGKAFTDEAATPSFLTRNNSAADLSSSGNTPKPLVSLAAREEASLAQHPTKQHASPLLFLFRAASLFVFGVAYGVIITHLHDRSGLSPASAGLRIAIDKWSTRYLVFWGLAGVGLGSVLPWLDGKYVDSSSNRSRSKRDWSPAVRSIGAFVGIAYAIRRLPWQSTLQVSLALALVNPFLWFLIDRTRSGFWFATLVGVAGTAFLLQISPEMIQAPAPVTAELVGGLVSVEGVAVGTWIASVLFCSCVCFGNVGRKLAVKGE